MARQAAIDGTAREQETKRRAEEKAARDKQQRVQHLTAMAARRMSRKDLSRGFGAWAEMVAEAVRQKRVLQAAAAKLTHPRLVATYRRWRHDWQVERTELASMSMSTMESELIHMRKELAMVCVPSSLLHHPSLGARC